MSFRRNIVLLLSVTLLAACDTAGALTAAGIVDRLDPLNFFTSPVNMMEKNYATADYLASRAGGYMKPGAKIKATPLLDVQEPRIITQLGKQIPEQVAQRLGQLGYKVDTSAVSTDVNPAFATAPQPVTDNPDFILSGSYVRKTSSLDLQVYIKDARTGMERASYAYTLKRTGAIRKNTTPQPMIYKTQ